MPAKASPRGPAAKTEGEAIPLRRFVSALFRRKWMIVSFTVGGLAVGLVACVFINPVNVWKGYIPVRVQSPSRVIGNIFDASPAGGREEFNIADEVQYWLSDRVLADTVRDCGLAEQQKEIYEKESQTLRFRIVEWFEDKLQGILPSQDTSASRGALDEDARFATAAKRHLMNEIDVRPSQMRSQDMSSYYIEISYRNMDYGKVREVLEALVENYQAYRTETVTDDFQGKIRKILDGRLEKAQVENRRLAADLSVKYKELGLIPGSDFNAIVEELRASVRENRARRDRLEDESRRVELQLSVAQSSKENLLSRKEDFIFVPTQGSGQQRSKDEVLFEAMVRKLVDLELELRKPGIGTTRRSEIEEEIALLRADIEKMNEHRTTSGEIQTMRSPELARLETDIETHKAILNGLKTDISEIQKKIAEDETKLAEAQAQVIEANRIRQQHDTSLARVERIQQQIEIQEASEEAQEIVEYVSPHDVRMEATQVPLHKFGRKVALLLATAFGLGLGIALALGLDILDSSLNSVDDMEEKVGLPVLASIQEYKKVRLIPRQG
ncbi:MAG: hypothetical protein JXP34_27050 [Planctomycetes bacterium]|nr:hypothetical protein [Planctomycetota bacterium]